MKMRRDTTLIELHRGAEAKATKAENKGTHTLKTSTDLESHAHNLKVLENHHLPLLRLQEERKDSSMLRRCLLIKLRLTLS